MRRNHRRSTGANSEAGGRGITYRKKRLLSVLPTWVKGRAARAEQQANREALTSRLAELKAIQQKQHNGVRAKKIGELIGTTKCSLYHPSKEPTEEENNKFA